MSPIKAQTRLGFGPAATSDNVSYVRLERPETPGKTQFGQPHAAGL
jgi:hypothetical protein